MFRGVMGAVTPVKVETQYGPLTFELRGVTVYDDKGTRVGYFNCEDRPDDFDEKAREAGWTRVGDYVNADGSFQMVPISGPQAPAQVGRSTAEVAQSAAWGVTKLGCMTVLLLVMLVFLFGIVTALFH